MLLGETIATGAPLACPECLVSVLPLAVLASEAGYYIGTRCSCGPSYTRESDYYPTQALADAALADRSFGRDGIVARDVDAYWTEDTIALSADHRRFNVTVLHNRSGRFRAYRHGDPLRQVVDLRVQAGQPEAAATIVFAIGNSYPDELLCDLRYADQVTAYRAAAPRSMSAGDVLLIRDGASGETALACAPAGFARLPATPPFAGRP